MDLLRTLLIFGVVVPLVLFGAWQLVKEGLVRVPSGTVGILIVRGKATSRVLTPGAEWVWPFRQQFIQGYPLRDLTYLAADDGAVESTDYADPPARARLGDRAPATLRYTVRFRIRPDGLLDIHERLGADGIKRLVRDETRRVAVAVCAEPRFGVDHSYGAGYAELEAALSAATAEALSAHGFEQVSYHLLDVDLGPIGEVMQATVRAKAELELERAAAAVRALRAEHDAATASLLGELTDEVLRYRRIELGREALQRWDGRIGVADAGIHRAITGEALDAIAGTDSDGSPMPEIIGDDRP